MFNSGDIVISRINYEAAQYQQVWDLREAVLRKPLGRTLKDDDLSRDLIDTIVIAEYSGKVIGCLLLHHIDGTQLQLRAMAVYDEWQGKGIGRLLVLDAEKVAGENGYDKIVLHARKVALGFYDRLGYAVCSEEFTEVGIPHFLMEKKIS